MIDLKIIALIIAFLITATKDLLPEHFKKSTGVRVFIFVFMLIALGVSIITSFIEKSNNTKQQSFQKGLIEKNDSLMTLVKELKAGTEKQSNLREQTIKYQISEDEPRITLNKIEISDEKYLADSTYAPKVTAVINNIGKRIAHNVTYRIWIVSYDFLEIRPGDKVFNDDLNPNESISIILLPKLISKKLPIHCCLEVKYNDKKTGKTNTKTFFNTYEKTRDTEQWNLCNTDKIREIVAVINEKYSPPVKP